MKHRDLVKAVEEAGFELVRIGKHEIYAKGSKRIQIPRHKEINELTAKAILKEAGVI